MTQAPPPIDMYSATDEEIDHYLDAAAAHGWYVKLPLLPGTREGALTFLRDHFRCQRGGDCCTGDLPANADEHRVIALQDSEVRKLARRLRMGRPAFLRKYAKWVDELQQWGMPYPCPFYEPKGHRCTVHDIKPLVCQAFPVTGAVPLDESQPTGPGNPMVLRVAAPCPGARAAAARLFRDFRDMAREGRRQ